MRLRAHENLLRDRIAVLGDARSSPKYLVGVLRFLSQPVRPPRRS